jgi:amylosucrase
LALLNDYGFKHEPERADDNRWVHRPAMNWDAAHAALKGQAAPHVQTMFSGIQQLIAARQRTPQLHAEIETVILESGNAHVFAYERPHPLGALLCLYNFSETAQIVSADLLHERGLWKPVDAITQQPLEVRDGVVWLEGYARLWLRSA